MGALGEGTFSERARPRSTTPFRLPDQRPAGTLPAPPYPEDLPPSWPWYPSRMATGAPDPSTRLPGQAVRFAELHGTNRILVYTLETVQPYRRAPGSGPYGPTGTARP